MRSTDNSAFIIAEIARYCARRRLPDGLAIKGAYAINYLAQVLLGWIFVQIKSYITQLKTS
jgi:hypothetical protein